jgi:hypothetical protein
MYRQARVCVVRHDRDVVIMLVGVGGEVDEAGDVMSE